VKSWIRIRIRIELNIQELKIEPWRAVVADSNEFGENHDPDPYPDPYYNGKLDPDPY
jgi:hypothetical protein